MGLKRLMEYAEWVAANSSNNTTFQNSKKDVENPCEKNRSHFNTQIKYLILNFSTVKSHF